MHCLHKILVYIPDVGSDDPRSIRDYAESSTDCFYEQAFDWRETRTAGRWEEVYPENVIFAKDSPERFISELNAAIDGQKSEIDCALKHLTENVSTGLPALVKAIWEKDGEIKDGKYDLNPYYFHKLADLLYGEYGFDSMLYNTHSYTARLYSNDIEAIKKEPEKWALVIFDYHN